MASYERRSESRSPPPRSRTPPSEDYPRSPPGASGRESRSRSRSRGDGRTPPPPRSRSRSPRRRSGSYDRRPRYDSPPRRGRGGPRDNREAPEPNKCLGVFGLSLHTTERELEKHFNVFGRIDKCQIVLDGHSGRSRGFGFIYFETIDDAAEARKEMDGKDLDGRQIRVDFSITQRPHTPTPGQYMGRPNREFRPRGRGGYRGGRGGGGRDYYDRDRGYGGDRYRDDRRYYEDRERDRYYSDSRRDDRDRYYDRPREGQSSYDRDYEDRRYDHYGPPPPSSYGKRPRPRSPSPYERDSRPRREYRSRSREYDRRY